MVMRFPVWMLGFITLSLITTPPVHCNVSCRDAVVTLLPCKPLLTGTAVNITAPCCDGARQKLCRCLKNLAASAKINADKANQIPRLCRIILHAPIDTSINCTMLRALSKRGGGGGGGDRQKHHKKTGMTLKNAKVGIYSRRFVAPNKKKHPRRRRSSRVLGS